MRIAIDLTALSYHITGIERYALCITKELLKKDKSNKYILIFRNEVLPELLQFIDYNKDTSIILKGDNKLLFYQYTLLKCLNSINADKYLFLAFVAPFFFRKKGSYSAIHDMVMYDFPSTLTFAKKIYARLCCYFTKINSDGIITVSNFSKERIADVLKVNPDKVHVIYSAVSDDIEKNKNENNDIRKKYKLPSKYILTLSTLEPRKNMKLLLDAYSVISNQVDYDLVLVGRTGWKIQKLLQDYSNQGRIHITGFVDDEDIACIYKNAMCFVFPTLYEGFGLPPVEALSLGTPVISSDAASMPEVLRKQATFFKSNDIKALEKLLVNLEDNLANMPRELDEFQKEHYRFDVSAGKILKLLERD